eukprot:6191029-Pleurochrysis_carterae.AAC.3
MEVGDAACARRLAQRAQAADALRQRLQRARERHRAPTHHLGLTVQQQRVEKKQRRCAAPTIPTAHAIHTGYSNASSILTESTTSTISSSAATGAAAAAAAAVAAATGFPQDLRACLQQRRRDVPQRESRALDLRSRKWRK